MGGTTDTVTTGSNSFKSGDSTPNGQAVFDLGSSDARWRRVHTSGLRVYDEQIVAAHGMSAGDSRITNVAAPTADADAATKKYVDDAISGSTTTWLDLPGRPSWTNTISAPPSQPDEYILGGATAPWKSLFAKLVTLAAGGCARPPTSL
jgi:hypothetical protein